ncbi:MAG: 30S ribosomal protein S4 [Oscillospiraceae bacterium]|nr:30S ribosomal protein S4 [Oscillospiraceae bacterium]
MARYTGAVCRICRREGKKMFMKGDRCYTTKCAIDERNDEKRKGTPGQHGMARKKISEYGMQLRAKQTARRYYGLLEGQFYHYFELATKMPGKAGENLLILLESRLDNVVYRLGFASSRPQARQLVLHKHFTVNGQKVNIPSYLLKAGDVVAFTEKARSNENLKSLVEANSGRTVPMWLSSDKENYKGTIERMPVRDDITLDVEEQLIVELYSK